MAILKKDIPSGIFNLVDKNLTIMEIAEAMNQVYPGIESFFINQNYTGFQLEVERTTKLNEFFQVPETDFIEELIEFKNSFAF